MKATISYQREVHRQAPGEKQAVKGTERVDGYSEQIPQVDITEPEHGVIIAVSPDRKTIWVNVDGICALRVCRIPHLEGI